jgi:hypothetical protein
VRRDPRAAAPRPPLVLGHLRALPASQSIYSLPLGAGIRERPARGVGLERHRVLPVNYLDKKRRLPGDVIVCESSYRALKRGTED